MGGTAGGCSLHDGPRLPHLAGLCAGDGSAARIGPRGVGFFGIDPGSGVSVESSRWWAIGWDLAFPILLDPLQTVARQAGLTVTPEAVVLLPDGQVLYRGRIDDRFAEAQGSQEPQARAGGGPRGDPCRRDAGRHEHGRPGHTTHREIAECRLRRDDHLQQARRADPLEELCEVPPPRGGWAVLLAQLPGRSQAGRLYPGGDRGRPDASMEGATRVPGYSSNAPRLSVIEKEILARWAETGCARRPGRPSASTAVLRRLVARPARPGADDARTPGTFARGRGPLSGLRCPLPSGSRRDHPGHRVPSRRPQDCPPQPDPSRRNRQRAPTRSQRPRSGLLGMGPESQLRAPLSRPRRLDTRHDAAIRPGRGRTGHPRGSDIVFQIHYHPSGKVERDQSTVGLYFAQGPVTRKLTGFTPFHRSDRHPRRREAAHDHPIRAAQGRRPSLHGRAPCPLPLPRIPAGRHSARWPLSAVALDRRLEYRLAGPVSLRLTRPITQGNHRDPGRLLRQLRRQSSQSQHASSRVRYGVDSKDEMCACHLEILPDDPSGYDVYPNKSPFGL